MNMFKIWEMISLDKKYLKEKYIVVASRAMSAEARSSSKISTTA